MKRLRLALTSSPPRVDDSESIELELLADWLSSGCDPRRRTGITIDGELLLEDGGGLEESDVDDFDLEDLTSSLTATGDDDLNLATCDRFQ